MMLIYISNLRNITKQPSYCKNITWCNWSSYTCLQKWWSAPIGIHRPSWLRSLRSFCTHGTDWGNYRLRSNVRIPRWCRRWTVVGVCWQQRDSRDLCMELGIGFGEISGLFLLARMFSSRLYPKKKRKLNYSFYSDIKGVS